MHALYSGWLSNRPHHKRRLYKAHASARSRLRVKQSVVFITLTPAEEEDSEIVRTVLDCCYKPTCTAVSQVKVRNDMETKFRILNCLILLAVPCFCEDEETLRQRDEMAEKLRLKYRQIQIEQALPKLNATELNKLLASIGDEIGSDTETVKQRFEQIKEDFDFLGESEMLLKRYYDALDGKEYMTAFKTVVKKYIVGNDSQRVTASVISILIGWAILVFAV